MRTRYFARKGGKFNWRCLFGHKWGAWSKPIIRTHMAGGIIGDDFIWVQRKCERCGSMHGRVVE